MSNVYLLASDEWEAPRADNQPLICPFLYKCYVHSVSAFTKQFIHAEM